MQLVPDSDYPRPHLRDMFKLLSFLNDLYSLQFYQTRLRQIIDSPLRNKLPCITYIISLNGHILN